MNVNVKIPAQLPSQYPIFIGSKIIEQIGSYIKTYTRASKILVVTNRTVDEIYGKIVRNCLEKDNVQHEFLVLEDGEKYKDYKTLQYIWDKSVEMKLERKDAMVALGGGVIGDLTGFAAATFLRGIDFIQVPTTLLAQVDSSVGGKVAINHPNGKNLLGAFYQPKFVLSDINTFKTLPDLQLKTGLAEVIKYGFIEKTCGLKNGEMNFLKYLKDNKDKVFELDEKVISKIVQYCCQLKAAVVNQDEKEKGLRAILNFGHTIGHAIEKCMNYEGFTHGQGVAIGTKGALLLGLKKGLIEKDYANIGSELIELYGINYKIPEHIKKEDIANAMLLDKKVISNKIRFVLPTAYGQVDIFDDISGYEILDVLEQLY